MILLDSLQISRSYLNIIEDTFNKKNPINSLNNSSNDNDSSQNYRRNFKQKESDQ